MEKKIFTLVLTVVIGILLGVGIVTKQAREPLLRELLKRQEVLLENQNKIKNNLGADLVFDSEDGNKVTALLNAQKNLENRISTLETKIEGFEDIFKQAKDGIAKARQAPPPEDLSKVYDIEIGHSPILGLKNAPITIVEFVDFQCPFCARFHPPVLEVLKAYPEKVNYVLKNFPLSFHPQAKPAAKAAFAAGEQGKYWEMTNALLENGSSLGEDKYSELAELLGLDVKKFKADYEGKDSKWENYVQKDMELGSKISVRGTPTFYINGKKTNARDFNSFKKEIDQILSN